MNDSRRSEPESALFTKVRATIGVDEGVSGAAQHACDEARAALDIIEERSQVAETRYGTIVADPPWCYRNSKALKSGAALRYDVMPVEDIAAVDVVRHAAFDSHCWLWTTNMFMEQAHWVMRSWGFQPLTILTWCKKQPGMGYYLRNNTEHCLLGSRGFPKPPDDKPLASWFVWPRGEHSQKPEAFYDIVEQVSPGPYLELFARRQRLGWHTWGNEALEHAEVVA